MHIGQFITSHKLLVFGGAAIAGACVAIATTFVLRRLRRTRKPSMPTLHSKRAAPKPLEATKGHKPPVALPASNSHEQPEPQTKLPVTPPWPTAPAVGGGISDNWAEFVRDRLGELDPTSCADETKWALGVVDFLDELKEAEGEASPEERKASATLRTALLSSLDFRNFKPVDSDEWNPERQRAVAVVRKPDATGTKILGKGSTGLSRNGKIIRKQEVKISTKGN